MEVQSQYTMAFASNDLTRQKYDELMAFALSVREHKNKVSELVNSNLLYYLDISKLSFLKEMREKFKGEIASSFDVQLYTSVYTAYQNKFKAVKDKMTFYKITYKGCEFYKRDTKKNKKGDFKKVVTGKEKTPLTIVLTWLARYGGDKTIEYLESSIDSLEDDKKVSLYKEILHYINKFGFEKLMRVALQRRNLIMDRYSKKPIEFKSLTFGGRSRKTDIIAYNKNFGSIINCFVSLSGFGRKSFDIPVKFSKDWHGSIKSFHKNNPDYEYRIIFNEKYHQVTVQLAKEGKRHIPDAGNNLVGIDANVKHNLLSLSNGLTIDYDRNLVNDYCSLSTKLDRLKKNKDYKVGRRNQLRLDALKRKMVKKEQESIALLCKELGKLGVDHIVMENLEGRFGKSFIKDKVNNDINFNRIVKFLGIASLKNEVEHIARKYGIALSTVHPEYTSKRCPVCGCIEDENRPNQETFECIQCGYKDNADHNAAMNIMERVSVAVLCDSLLKRLDNGAYEPKKLKREKVKEVLLSFRRSLNKAGGESKEIIS